MMKKIRKWAIQPPDGQIKKGLQYVFSDLDNTGYVLGLSLRYQTNIIVWLDGSSFDVASLVVQRHDFQRTDMHGKTHP